MARPGECGCLTGIAGATLTAAVVVSAMTDTTRVEEENRQLRASRYLDFAVSVYNKVKETGWNTHGYKSYVVTMLSESAELGSKEAMHWIAKLYADDDYFEDTETGVRLVEIGKWCELACDGDESKALQLMMSIDSVADFMERLMF